MNTYKIITLETQILRCTYYVEAESEKAAEQELNNGNCVSDTEDDEMEDWEILEVESVELIGPAESTT